MYGGVSHGVVLLKIVMVFYSNLYLLVFCGKKCDILFFQVQSRSRSVVELQVSGVRLSFTKRPYDTSLTLSVHGLLLVDALQTFGPDFELLVASHKHVGFVLLPVKSMWCVYLSIRIKGLTYC